MTQVPTRDTLDELVSVLDLEEARLNLYRGRTPKEDRIRVFGGQVAGQAWSPRGAYGRARHGALLHAYFLRPGDPSIPMLYQVDRIRDGKSFTTRRVVAIQRGNAIFNLSASFQREGGRPRAPIPMPESPTDPESLPTFKQRTERCARPAPRRRSSAAGLLRERPIAVRPVEPIDYSGAAEARAAPALSGFAPTARSPMRRCWHHCVVAYASDMTLIDTATLPTASHGGNNSFQMASLDHTRCGSIGRFAPTEWLLYSQ